MSQIAERYWREIAVILIIKVVALYAIHETYFDQPVTRAERVRHMQSSIYSTITESVESTEEYTE